MPSLVLDISADVYEQLCQAAAANHRSIAAEALQQLRQSFDKDWNGLRFPVPAPFDLPRPVGRPIPRRDVEPPRPDPIRDPDS